MEITPLRGKLLVEIIPDIKRTESGLYIAETVKDIPHRGRVLTLGLPFRDDKDRQYEWDIAEDEIVHFKRNWTAQQGTHIILKRDEIFAAERGGCVMAVQDFVIVKRVYTGKIGSSTLIIPDMAETKSNTEDFYGLVIDVGIENKMGIKAGDKLLYHRNEGQLVKLPNRDEYFSLKPRAILALFCEQTQ